MSLPALPDDRRPIQRGRSGLVAAAMLLVAFGLIAYVTFSGAAAGFDRAILLGLRVPGDPSDLLGPPWLEEAARDVTALGSNAVVGLLLLVAFATLFILSRRGDALWLLATIISGALVNDLLKAAFDRPRPDIVSHAARVFTTSFPSGHAALSAVSYLSFALLAAGMSRGHGPKILFLALALFLTFLVGLTRIYLGLHYPTDVLAGWCVGGASALIWRSLRPAPA